MIKIYTLYIAPYCGSNDGGDFAGRVYSSLDLQKVGKRLLKIMEEWMSTEQLEKAKSLFKEKRIYDLVAMNKESFPYDSLFEFEVQAK